MELVVAAASVLVSAAIRIDTLRTAERVEQALTSLALNSTAARASLGAEVDALSEPVVRTAAVSAPSPPPPMSPRPSPPTQSPAAPRALTFSEDPAQITMLSLSAVGWLVLIVASLSCWTCYRKRIRARAKMEAKASQQDRQEEQATAAAGQLAPPNAGVALPHPQRLPAPLEGQADAASAIATSAPREVAPGDDTPGDDTPADDASCVDSSGALPFAEAAVSASEATTPALSPRLTPRAALVSGGYVRV